MASVDSSNTVNNPPPPPTNPGSEGTTITITSPVDDPWWQVKDGDVTATADLSSMVPDGLNFIDDGAGGYPGVPVYGGNFNYSPGGISSTGWKVNSSTTNDKIYNYSYFESLIPDDITFADATTSSLESGGTTQDGYYWYLFDGTSGPTFGQDMEIDGLNLGNRKVALFVRGADLDITGNINLNDGSGLFAVFVDGQIRVDSGVTGSPSLEGIYLADGGFNSGPGNLPLHIRGSVASFGGFSLLRDLDDDSQPAELFEYAPDQLFLFPQILSSRKTRWIEVTP